MSIQQYRYTALLVPVLLLFFVMTGCNKDKNPVDAHEDHNEAEGMVLKINGANVVVVKEGKVQSGTINAKAGESTAEISARFLDHDGDEFIPDEVGSSLAFQFADASIADAAMVSGNEWEFKVNGKKAGSTTMVVKLMHHDHADFITPAIPVIVTN